MCGALAPFVAADAAPLDLKHVSGEAKWLGHLDFDAMRKSVVVQKAMERHKQSGRMAMAGAMLGMDLEKDLRGLTFYGREVGRHEGVMILHARVDRNRMLGMAKMLRPTVSDYGTHKLHGWSHKSQRTGQTHTAAVAFHGDDSVVFAHDVDELKRAIDVLDGKAKSLTADASLGGNIPAGTTMLMRVEGAASANLPEKCKLARQTRSFRFVTGEHEGESFFRARAVMTGDDVAGDLKEIVEGLKALGSLHVGDDPAGNRLVDDLRVERDGATLTVLWKGSADDVWKIVESHRKIFEERMKRYRSEHGTDRAPSRKPSPEKDF